MNIGTDYYVDIPSSRSECWLNVGQFEAQEDALAFVRRQYGADDKGRVQLITAGGPDMYYVDIPPSWGKSWVSVEHFEVQEEALAFVQERFGADEQGRISLVSAHELG